MASLHIVQNKAWIKHLIGGGITLLCLLIFFRQVDLRHVLQALSAFKWQYLALGLASLAIGYALRIFRWAVMLRSAGASITFLNCAPPFLASIALNNMLPLRLGDVVRALIFPNAIGVAKTTATSSLIIERLIDLMTLLASMAVGLYAIQTVEIPAELRKSGVGLALFGGALLAGGFLYSGTLSRLFADMSRRGSIKKNRADAKNVYLTLSAMLMEFDAMSRLRVLLPMLLVSMLIWVGEAGLFYFIMLGLDIDSSMEMALLVMSVATLSTLVPSSPGYVGPFHLAAFTAISLAGATATQAGSYAVLVHLSLWLPTTLIGIIVIWVNPELFRSARSQPT